jgi:bifunctional non-homologous end joining protein LigD
MSPVTISEQRDGVDLTNLDQPLGPDAGATKRDLVDYLEAIADQMLPGLVGRPLTVLRVLRGRAPFMQKNVPKYTPDWVRTVRIWAEASKREGPLRGLRQPKDPSVVREPTRH